jgi:hypothetical protein
VDKYSVDSFACGIFRAVIMIVVNDGILRTFIRLQLASGKKREEAIKYVFNAANGLYQEIEIEDMVNEIYAEGIGRNQEVMDKLLSMISTYVIPDYEGENVDEDGLDEADRMMMEVIESVGIHGC